MPTLPGNVALTTIADGASIVAVDHRNNYSALQTAVNNTLNALNVGVSGQVLTGSGTTLTWGGTYTSYTPTWTTSGSAPAIGNGTVVGRYVQLGKLVVGSIVFTAGSTTTFGTGVYSFSVPVTALSSGWIVGGAVGNDTGVAAYIGAMRLATTATFDFLTPASPGGNWTNTIPFTFGSGDTFNASFTYEAA